MKWDREIADKTLFIKHVAHVAGRRIDIHRFSKPDRPNVFHSHPATAIRIVYMGGYEEEIYDNRNVIVEDGFITTAEPTTMQLCLPGFISIICPGFIHRVNRLIDGPSYSIWIRGVITDPIYLLQVVSNLAHVHKSSFKED